MAQFLIEVPHAETREACYRAFQTFIDTGSHFLANADWGCEDHEHKAWLIVDVDSKEQALQIVPPLYRGVAKITSLFKVTREEVDRYRNEKSLEEDIKFHG